MKTQTIYYYRRLIDAIILHKWQYINRGPQYIQNNRIAIIAAFRGFALFSILYGIVIIVVQIFINSWWMTNFSMIHRNGIGDASPSGGGCHY